MPHLDLNSLDLILRQSLLGSIVELSRPWALVRRMA